MKKTRRLIQKILCDLIMSDMYKNINEFLDDVEAAINNVRDISDIVRLARGVEGPNERLIENQMWECCIGITVGEYEHCESVYFFGKEEDAQSYLSSYLETIWGMDGETHYDSGDECYYDKLEQKAAIDAGVQLYNSVTAMTEKGTLRYEAAWRLAR